MNVINIYSDGFLVFFVIKFCGIFVSYLGTHYSKMYVSVKGIFLINLVSVHQNLNSLFVVFYVIKYASKMLIM